MDEYAGKGESRNHWSNKDEQQARTGKGETETIGRAKMSSRQEQGKARTANISGKQDHGKSIKTRAPGEARDAGAIGTGGAAGAAGAASSGFMPVLVGTLSQPMLYFSKRQRNVIVCCGLSALGLYADHPPGLFPAYIVLGALGFDAKGINRAVKDFKEGPTFGQQSLRMFT